MTQGAEEKGMFVRAIEEVGGHVLFFRDTVRWTFRPPFDGKNILNQMLEIGYRSLPVTAITLFFTGMVMALQVGRAMDKLMAGSSIFIGSAATNAPCSGSASSPATFSKIGTLPPQRATWAPKWVEGP